MSFTWREHDEAHDELRQAAHRYSEISNKLGERFVSAVESALESVLDPAFRWGFYRDRISEPQVYARSVAGFPFQVVYVLRAEEVVVLAYAHERRQPEYWAHRLNGEPSTSVEGMGPSK